MTNLNHHSTVQSQEILESLNDRSRRIVLRAISRAEDDRSVSQLARDIIAVSNGECLTGGTTVSELRTRLHHVHLPKLDDAGLITYDADDGVVAATDLRERIRVTVATMDELSETVES